MTRIQPTNRSETMGPREIRIALSEISGEALCSVEINEIGPCDETDLGQVVCRDDGVLSIVDGFHRTAGQLVHCQENGIDPASYYITVVLACDDVEEIDDDIRDAVENASMPGENQDEALSLIYERAGR